MRTFSVTMSSTPHARAAAAAADDTAATRVPRYLAQTVTFPLLPSSDQLSLKYTLHPDNYPDLNGRPPAARHLLMSQSMQRYFERLLATADVSSSGRDPLRIEMERREREEREKREGGREGGRERGREGARERGSEGAREGERIIP